MSPTSSSSIPRPPACWSTRQKTHVNCWSKAWFPPPLCCHKNQEVITNLHWFINLLGKSLVKSVSDSVREASSHWHLASICLWKPAQHPLVPEEACSSVVLSSMVSTVGCGYYLKALSSKTSPALNHVKIRGRKAAKSFSIYINS